MIVTDKTWTLFLDRDGVINRRIPGAYVSHWDEFEWLDNSLEAIVALKAYFRRIFVITNQQGVGKGIMTEQELNKVHGEMMKTIQQAGGHLDGIYACTDLATKENNCRKPSPSMGLQAKRDFPDIHFNRSIMVGDSISDMEFGHALGANNILISGKQEEEAALQTSQTPIDAVYPSLWEWTLRKRIKSAL